MSCSFIRLIFMVVALMLLSACRAGGNYRAPVEERTASSRSATENRNVDDRKAASGRKYLSADQGGHVQLYVIQKGDTLFSIAFENGLDYREVAEQNNIENPAAIQVGQQIKLYLPDEQLADKNVKTDSRSVTAPTSAVVVERKDYPKLVKLPYSENAVDLAERMQGESGKSSVLPVPTVPQAKPPAENNRTQPDVEPAGNDISEWGLPAHGKVIAEFSETANRKGVDIAGTRGQPILASAAGKVVYSGSGLRGYGKLVIIKHNKTYLSAYAHNDQILVKEGQMVAKGQKIAEMGSSDSEQVKLHFEIRRFGKPVDPAKYINLGKS